MLRRSTMVVAGLLVITTLAALAQAQALRLGTVSPEIEGAPWINSPPLTTAALRGRVVLVEFWTYG